MFCQTKDEEWLFNVFVVIIIAWQVDEVIVLDRLQFIFQASQIFRGPSPGVAVAFLEIELDGHFAKGK